jgi:cobalt-zinc-cadmium efflux system protein
VSRTGRLLVTLVVNVALVVGELAAGLAAHSTGLLADAGHNVTDVAAVLLSLIAVRWAMRPRSDARSYGNHRGTILAALANAAVLAVMTCAIVAVGIDRLLSPSPVDGTLVAVVAGVALVANGTAALVLSHEAHDLNMRSVLVHMTSDMAASLVVMVAGIVVAIGGQSFDRADPAASLLVGLLILVEAVRVLRESADVLLESTPADVDLAALRAAVTAVPGVGEVHDLHVWSLSSDYRALSAHLVLTGHPTLEGAQEVGGRVRAELTRTFDIAHTTFEMECERCDDEAVDPCAVDPSVADDHHAEAPRGVAG